MKLHKQFQIAAACSDKPASNQSNVYADTKSEMLYASNNRILAMVPYIPGDHEQPATLPVEAVKAAQKNGGILALTPNAVTVGAVTHHLPERPFPIESAMAIVSRAKETHKHGSGQVFEIGIDADLLLALAKAIGAKDNKGFRRLILRGRLELGTTTLDPIEVTTGTEPRAFGLIAPVRI